MPETTRYVFALVNNIVSSQFSTPYSIVKHIIWVDILRAELRSIFSEPRGAAENCEQWAKCDRTSFLDGIVFPKIIEFGSPIDNSFWWASGFCLRLKQSFIFLMFEMVSHYFFKFRYFSITPKVQLSKWPLLFTDYLCGCGHHHELPFSRDSLLANCSSSLPIQLYKSTWKRRKTAHEKKTLFRRSMGWVKIAENNTVRYVRVK